MKAGAIRVDLDGNPCGELEEQHVAHARQQLEEAKARVQAQRASQQAESPLPRQANRKKVHAASVNRVLSRRLAVKKVVNSVSRVLQLPKHRVKSNVFTPVSDVSVLSVGQALKVKAGNNAMDATVVEITKDGVRVQLTSGMSMIVRAEHLVF